MNETGVQKDLLRSRVSKDLSLEISADAAADETFKVIIECNRSFRGGIQGARTLLIMAYNSFRKSKSALSLRPSGPIVGTSADISLLADTFKQADVLYIDKSLWTDSYIFGRLTKDTIAKLSDWRVSGKPLIYKIWRDHQLERCIYESVRTIKCDAARISFAAAGKGIVWAVADTGIDENHPHFKLHETVVLEGDLSHRDFTAEHETDKESSDAALIDTDGHGTHVAGIIAGRTVPLRKGKTRRTITVQSNEMNPDGTAKPVPFSYDNEIAGLAPFCKLVSLKVLDSGKEGDVSNLLAAIGFIQRMNDNGRTIRIHGLNLSLGYTFNPAWYAAGQSPLCTEVDRLVRSGVCVVVAAGNAGYGTVTQQSGQSERAAHLGTIMDPGNAALAITVGSTHRDRPHTYGVSYFSSKGPTADGRMKPDLVAPGEHIISCAANSAGEGGEVHFREDSGTSMAAPHVSGAIAAFLSVRVEFQGQPEQVKEVFKAGATDLKRRPEFQGAGLIDLMRTLQAV